MIPTARVQGPRRETGEISGASETQRMVCLVDLVCFVFWLLSFFRPSNQINQMNERNQMNKSDERDWRGARLVGLARGFRP